MAVVRTVSLVSASALVVVVMTGSQSPFGESIHR
jgi:hypothetical protein